MPNTINNDAGSVATPDMGPIFIKPPGGEEVSVEKAKVTPQTWFRDTTAVAEKDRYETSRNSLDKMPPPSPEGPVVGTTNQGNIFLTPNSLTAFFMAFTELSNIMRQMTSAGLKQMLTQMTMATELAKCIKEQKKTAATAEASMYIASAVSNFAEGLGAAVQLVGSARAQKKAESKMGNEGEKLKQNVDKTQNKLESKTAKMSEMKAEKNLEVTQHKNKVDAARDKLNKATTPEEINSAKDGYETAKNDLRNARSSQRTELDARQDKVDTADKKAREAKHDKAKFDSDYQSNIQGEVQKYTNKTHFTSTILTKALQGSADLAKAAFVLQKGAAEGEEAMLNSYLQNVNKQEDSLREYIKSSHDTVSQLMQALQKFSDDQRKLGGSLGTQA